MVSTADSLIYAIGGGHGHARRGWLIQRLLAERGRSAVLLIRPGSDRHLPPGPGPRLHASGLTAGLLAEFGRRPPARLVVDTFAAGWRGELDAAWLSRFDRRLLVARYTGTAVEPPVQYQRVVAPYPADRCEWRGMGPGAAYGGYLIDASHVRIDHDDHWFAVFDPACRCPPRLRETFARAAARAGLGCRFHDSFARPIRARKLLVVGAGYHTFYEAIGRGVDVRFLPVRKRHDDQSRRTALFGLALESLDDLPVWLAATARPVAENTACDAAAWWSLLEA
jgi:hypothetical protein